MKNLVWGVFISGFIALGVLWLGGFWKYISTEKDAEDYTIIDGVRYYPAWSDSIEIGTLGAGESVELDFDLKKGIKEARKIPAPANSDQYYNYLPDPDVIRELQHNVIVGQSEYEALKEKAAKYDKLLTAGCWDVKNDLPCFQIVEEPHFKEEEGIRVINLADLKEIERLLQEINKKVWRFGE